MSVIIAKEESYYFTTENASDPNVTVSPDGSSMTINLDTPIEIPSSSVHSTLEVQTANIWNVSPNISAAFRNNRVDYKVNKIAQPSIVIPDGQYSLSSINQALAAVFQNRGQSSNLISFAGNDATQRAIVIFDKDVQIDFGAVNSIGTILGFPAVLGLTPRDPAPSDGYSVEGSTEASLNRVNSYLITSTICPTGIPINNSGLNVIAQIPITSRAGSQIIYAPYNPTKVNINILRGHRKNNVTFNLVDQAGRPTPTLGETWGLLLTIRSQILLTSEKMPMMDL